MIDRRATTMRTITVTDHEGTNTAPLCDRCDHPIWNPDDARQLKDGRYHHRHWTDCIGYLKTSNVELKRRLFELAGDRQTHHFTLNYRDPVTNEFVEKRYLAFPLDESDADDTPFIVAPTPQEEPTT